MSFIKTSFFVPMKPKAKGRPRFTRRGHVYTPTATRKAEEVVALYAKQVAPKQPARGPIKLVLDFCFSAPTSWPKSKRSLIVEGGDVVWHTKKPDLDNLEKLIKDSLGGIFYNDDRQVACVFKSKRYSLVDGIFITVEVM